MEKELNTLCDKVRYAVSFEEELTEEMREHIKNCDECRAYFEQTEKMAAELSAMNVASLTKNGMSVADSVMSEIKKQAVFTMGKPVKKAAFIRHAGLIAACLVLVVMAIPVIKGMYGAKSEDAAYEYEYMQNGAALYDIADEESLPEEDAGEVKMMAAKSYNDTVEYEAVTEAEEKAKGTGSVNGILYDAFDGADGETTSAQQPESQNSAVADYRADPSGIYAYCEEYAKEVCVTCGLEYGRFGSLTYEDDNTACAIYLTTSDEQIILQLVKNGDIWEVINAEVYL